MDYKTIKHLKELEAESIYVLREVAPSSNVQSSSFRVARILS